MSKGLWLSDKLMVNAQMVNCWFYQEEMVAFFKVILEPAPEGTYIFVYKTARTDCADEDYLQDDIDDAKRFCEQELGLRKDGWKEDASIVKLMS